MSKNKLRKPIQHIITADRKKIKYYENPQGTSSGLSRPYPTKIKKGINMKSQEARDYVKTIEADCNDYNNMIKFTLAHQAVRMAEIELTEKAIEAFRLFIEEYCAESGRTDISNDSEHYMEVFSNLINSK